MKTKREELIEFLSRTVIVNQLAPVSIEHLADCILEITEGYRMKVISHRNKDCPRVAMRLYCDECGYPTSEARFIDEKEAKEFLTDQLISTLRG